MQAADDPQRRVLPGDLARILHDLRGPLNSLTMHLEVLKRTAKGDAGAEESLRTALQQLGRLAEMGAVVALTADHGMNDKSNAAGEPNVIWLQDILDERFGKGDVDEGSLREAIALAFEMASRKA